MLPSNWYENSACNGCNYGERITAGVFCSELQELVPVGYVGCKAERDYYEEIDKMENGITLTELAHELRKIFKFKYLTMADYKHEGPVTIDIWSHKPYFRESDCTWNGEGLIESKDLYDLDCVLDLSEYADENINIDYSKCIVEVE